MKDGKSINCSNISKATVENSLFAQGATSTYRTHINSNFSMSDSFANANYTYVGIHRTDNPNNALTDIRLYVAGKGEYPEKEIKRTITYNGETFPVTYTLVSRASLTEQGNKSEANCAKERQVYVYASSNPALGEPITEIKMDTVFSYDDFEPVFTMDNKHLFSLSIDSSNSIFVDSDYYLYGNHLSFKREGADKPYIRELEIVAVENDEYTINDQIMAVTELIELGYTDVINKNMNANTTHAGKVIYIGMSRTGDTKDAVYDIRATDNQGKNPKQIWDDFTLVENIDLNAKTWFGPYIHLYQSKEPIGTPLMDLKAVDEKYKSATTDLTKLQPGDVVPIEAYVVNQDFKNQDFNDGAGGDWIFLIKCSESIYAPNSIYIGSMLGTGSVAVIGLFLAAAAGAIIYVKLKKKRAAVTVGEATAEETDEI